MNLGQPCGVVYDSFYKRHLTGTGHPEKPERAAQVFENLEDSKLLGSSVLIDPIDAQENSITLIHEKKYLEQVKNDVKSGHTSLSTGDTNVSNDSYLVAIRACGGALHAIDQIFENKIKRAFSISRPPGHHASPGRGMGFCILNHVAIAARYAQKKFGVGKVLIVDWDVHHGNGTQDCFYEDESVFFISAHQSPWYPGTGRPNETGSGKGLGLTFNAPLPAGSGRSEIVEGVFGTDLPKKMNDFRPELILVSAGFDSRIDDPLGQFTLQDNDFYDLTKCMLSLAQEFSNGRLLSILEGGYNSTGLKSASKAHFRAMLEN